MKDLNSNFKETSEKVAVNHPSLEDIITSIGMSYTSKLDPYFSIQRVKDGYMMGTKKVTFDYVNIYIDDIKCKGTHELWKLIMMKKQPKLKDRQDLINYAQILKQTAAITVPRNTTAKSKPCKRYKYKNLLSILLKP